MQAAAEQAAVPVPWEGGNARPQRAHRTRGHSTGCHSRAVTQLCTPILNSGEQQSTYLQGMQASSSVLSQHLEYIAYVYERDAWTICVKPSANSLPFPAAAPEPHRFGFTVTQGNTPQRTKLKFNLKLLEFLPPFNSQQLQPTKSLNYHQIFFLMSGTIVMISIRQK